MSSLRGSRDRLLESHSLGQAEQGHGIYDMEDSQLSLPLAGHGGLRNSGEQQ